METVSNAGAGEGEMSGGDGQERTAASIDETDRKILRELQRDSTPSLERLARKVGASKTAVWNRIQRLQRDGVILRQAAVLDPARVGLAETFFIAVRTNHHNAAWLERFSRTVQGMPEILEAHRLAGHTDYLLKVQVASTREFDECYNRLVAEIDLFDVTSSLSMECLKNETALPI
jgi:Lrp/AsnC family transcriptional regulator